jgi:hypothetical protein
VRDLPEGGGVTAPLAEALARRGRVWGAQNAEVLKAIRAGTLAPRLHGGPTLEGRIGFTVLSFSDRGAGMTHGFRRLAAPAP